MIPKEIPNQLPPITVEEYDKTHNDKKGYLDYHTWDYYKDWYEGKHDNDYDNCQFIDDKLSFAINWINNIYRSTNNHIDPIYVKPIIDQKMRIITDLDYRARIRNLSDKYKVRNKLFKMGYKDLLIPVGTTLLKKGEVTPEALEKAINEIPEDIVWLKTNHGSGWNLRVDKKNLTTTYKYIAHKINEWFDLNYAYISGYEAQYEEIEPVLLIEPELVYQPIDYSFWCYKGEIKGIGLTKKLGKNFEEYLAFVNKEGKESNWYIGYNPELKDLPKIFKEKVDTMIPIAEDLSKDFDFVRVDFFNINGKNYLSELTFTPCSGFLECNYKNV